MSKEANIAFWLPRVLPDKVRVIITCDKSSESYAYFLKNQAKILEIHSDIEITNFMIKRNEEKEGFAELEVRKKILNCLMQYNEALKKNCKFVEIFLACFLPAPNDLIPKLANRELIELDQILKTLDLGRLSSIF